MPLTFDESTSFACSDLDNYVQEIKCKNAHLVGVASLSNSCLLAVYLATLKQKNDVCILSRRISWAPEKIPGVSFAFFSHSKRVSPDIITHVEVSQGKGYLGVTLATETETEHCKDLLVFEDYLGIDPMRFTGCKNLEKRELGK